jgi:uncharacterized membrane protein
LDVLRQLEAALGFGHDYSTDYVRGWPSFLPPEGWTDADTERLERFMKRIAGNDSEP